MHITKNLHMHQSCCQDLKSEDQIQDFKRQNQGQEVWSKDQEVWSQDQD